MSTSTLKNRNGLYMHDGRLWTHTINNKHQGNFKKLLMIGYNGLNTSSRKGIEMRMKTTISLYGKGNEVVP
jgi:hypothetical protein